ncbi:MAG TPA: RNA polymerase sigma factor region1.1 domain-containing protein, partial [Burkholderiaceae bacterium]|nr:RNA polymerase sigma factor region1.1 domain-containing protein [Burkholderiaceae bacterium]
MPTKKPIAKSVKLTAKNAVKTAAKTASKPVAKKTAVKKPETKKASKTATATTKAIKAPSKPSPKAPLKVKPVPASKKTASKANPEVKKPTKATAKVAAKEVVEKVAKPSKSAKTTPVARVGAKRGPKPKGSIAKPSLDDEDLNDIEDDLVGEPIATNESGEKVKPLRMKISKAKERALIKEFGLDDTVLSEEDLAIRRLRLKQLIKLGKTRGYLTHGEISDHLPDKL